MDHDVSQCEALQGDDGQADRPGAHHRHGKRIIQVPENAGEKERRQKMKTKQWFHAQIRWAVLEEGKRGLRSWEESAYIFQSDNHEAAFEQALAMGRRHQNISKKGRRLVATKLVEIVSLDCCGPNPSEFPLSPRGSQKATECLPFDHVFHPEGSFPPPSF